MSKKNNKLKLPKRLLGVKLPKDARRQVNRLLKQAPTDSTKPMITAAVAVAVTALASRLEQPLLDMLKGKGAAPTPGARATH